ncbi:MAG: DUF924 domain-containing protein [Rhodocyclaceae bacterium]|nr:DUF924 domain-containing protein [Rhodocyclaceae bacterium]MBX3667829.1 DUF924 domain-containing protein [Rhodocyclaceae bacterium]
MSKSRAEHSAVQAVLDFWFMPAGHTQYGQPRREWFYKDPAFDAAVRAQFEPLCVRALAGGLLDWERTPLGRLARVIVLDQFPRNLYRGDARAFSGDPLALAAAQRALHTDEDRGLLPVQRQFLYMPYQHSENIAMQEISVALFLALLDRYPTQDMASAYDYALRHEAIVRRFGRFPHRNEILGRESTAEEVEFLRQPGSHF